MCIYAYTHVYIYIYIYIPSYIYIYIYIHIHTYMSYERCPQAEASFVADHLGPVMQALPPTGTHKAIIIT